jgi:hypothetical protein
MWLPDSSLVLLLRQSSLRDLLIELANSCSLRRYWRVLARRMDWPVARWLFAVRRAQQPGAKMYRRW